MKKLLLASITLFFVEFSIAQSHYVAIPPHFYNDPGSIVEIIDDSPSISYEFSQNEADGIAPYKIIKASTGLVYGITLQEVIETYGVNLFSFDVSNNQYQSLINFNNETYGTSPKDIIEIANGLIYVYMSSGNTSGNGFGQGKLIEYNPSNGNHFIAHVFGDLFTSTTLVEPIKLMEKDNIIYGVKRWGANNDLNSGTIFSYNTLTHTFTVLHESVDLKENVKAFLASNGIIYGVTASGGANNAGYLYSYNTQSDVFQIIQDLDIAGEADITEVNGGIIYGVLENSHGVDGCIFKINSSQDFIVEYEFDNSTLGTGFKPYEIESFESNLFILNKSSIVDVWGDNKDLLIDYDTSNSTLYIAAGNVGNGTDFKPELYVMNDGRLLSKIDLSLLSYYSGDTYAQSIFQYAPELTSIVDMNDSNLSIEDDLYNTKISIYPNPTNGLINISSINGIERIELYTLQGQEVDVTVIDNTIDVSKLPKGVYLLSLTSDNKTEIKRIIKH